VLVFILALSFVTLPAASGGTPEIWVSPTTVSQGESIEVTGSGFSPNVQVTLYLGTGGGGAYVFNPNSDGSGSFSYTMLIGTNVAAGQHDVRAEDPSEGSSNTVWITVTEGSQQTTVTFTFIVVDADSGSPISGASVYLDSNFQGTTGSDGRVGVSTTYPPANHGWSVSASGYQDASGTVSIGSNSGGSFTVHLTRSGGPATALISVTPTTVSQGQSITVSGSGFSANSGITVYVGIGGGSAFSWDKTADGSGNLASFQITIGTNVPTGQRDVRAVDQTTGTSSNTIWITVNPSSALIDIDLPSPNNDPAFHYWAKQVSPDYYTANKATIDQTILIHYQSTKALMNAWGTTSVASLGSGCASGPFGVGVFSVLFDGTRGGGGSGLDRCEQYVDANTQLPGGRLLWSRGVIVGETVNTIMAGLGGTGGYPRTWFTDDIWYFPAAVTGKALPLGGYGDVATQWLSSECYTACSDTTRYNANSAYVFWNSFTLDQLGAFLRQIKNEGLNLSSGKLYIDESACGPADNSVNDPGLSIKSTYMMVLLAYTSVQNIKAELPNYEVVGGMCTANPTGWHYIKVDSTMYDKVKAAHAIIMTLPRTDQNYQYWLSGDYDKIINPTTQTYTASTGTTITQTSTVISTTIMGLQMQVVSNSSVSDLVFDSTRGLLNFIVSGPEGSHGFFDATIAKSLLHGQPVVLIDGVERPASVTQDAGFWYIHVTYSLSQHHVMIGGSNTVPEFPSVSLLAIVLVLVIVIFRRRNKR